MECNKEDAAKAKQIAEEKMSAGDFVGARKFVSKAQRLFPNLENILQMKTICDVHVSATTKIEGLENWYGVLKVQPIANESIIKKQYRKLSRILHPDKNKYAGTEAAFKLVGEANRWLSDNIKRSQYDVRYRCYSTLAYVKESKKMDKNGTVGRNFKNKRNRIKVAGGRVSKKDEGCTEDAAEVRKPQTAMTNSDEVPKKTDVLNAQQEVKVPQTSATKTIPSAPENVQTAKKTRKAVAESFESSEVDGSDIAGTKTNTNGYKKRRSPRKKLHISYAEGGSNGDFVSHRKKKTRWGREFESYYNTEHTAEDNKSPKLPDSGVSFISSHAYKGNAKENVNSGNEDIVLAKNKESESCDGNGEDVALSSKIDRVENGYKTNENPSTLGIPDPKVKVKANSVTETDPTQLRCYFRKRRNSDDDNGVCNNLEEVQGDARKSHFLSCQVDEPRLGQKVEDRKNELALLKNQVESEEKKLVELQREMEEVTGRRTKDLELVHSKIKESGKQRAAVDEQLESQRTLLEIQSAELDSKKVELECVRESLKHYNSDLKLKEKLVQSLNNRVTVCNKTIDSRSEELRKIQKLIEQQTNELAVLYNQGDSIKQLIQELSEKLIVKEKELECVAKSSKCLELDDKVKEKRVQALNNQITTTSEQLDLKSKELGEIQRELELKKQLRKMSNVLVKREKQPAAASTIDTSQQYAAETEPIDDDALLDYEVPANLTRHEVFNVLRALSNPAEFILEEVKEHIREELGLQDSVLEIFVLFFGELTKIDRSDDPQLQEKATQVATIWKGNISIEAPRSSLEALAFLLFIVAYGLKKLINEEETALLASSIAHYEQAPRIFYSLSLNSEMRQFVKELIKKSLYIPAVRLICLYKFNEDEEFSPSHLITKEIINLRRSALEMGPTESSQAKDKDAGKMRAILELVADYEINLPGYLIAKLMIQREN